MVADLHSSKRPPRASRMRIRWRSARRIELSLEAEPAVVQGDPEALRTLVRNLVDNAVRYTPEGGRVRVRTRGERVRRRARGQSIPGPGIPAPDRERAFDRFYRRANAPAGGQRSRARHRQGHRGSARRGDSAGRCPGRRSAGSPSPFPPRRLRFA